MQLRSSTKKAAQLENDGDGNDRGEGTSSRTNVPSSSRKSPQQRQTQQPKTKRAPANNARGRRGQINPTQGDQTPAVGPSVSAASTSRQREPARNGRTAASSSVRPRPRPNQNRNQRSSRPASSSSSSSSSSSENDKGRLRKTLRQRIKKQSKLVESAFWNGAPIASPQSRHKKDMRRLEAFIDSTMTEHRRILDESPTLDDRPENSITLRLKATSLPRELESYLKMIRKELEWADARAGAGEVRGQRAVEAELDRRRRAGSPEPESSGPALGVPVL